jgi:hypothetical protein
MNNTQRNKLIEEKCRALIANTEELITFNQRTLKTTNYYEWLQATKSLQIIHELKEILGYSKPEGKLEQIEIKF